MLRVSVKISIKTVLFFHTFYLTHKKNERIIHFPIRIGDDPVKKSLLLAPLISAGASV